MDDKVALPFRVHAMQRCPDSVNLNDDSKDLLISKNNIVQSLKNILTLDIKRKSTQRNEITRQWKLMVEFGTIVVIFRIRGWYKNRVQPRGFVFDASAKSWNSSSLLTGPVI